MVKFVKEKVTLPTVYKHELLLPCFMRNEYISIMYNKMLKHKNQLVTPGADKPLLTARTNNNNEKLFTQTQLVYRIVRVTDFVTSETIPFTDVVHPVQI